MLDRDVVEMRRLYSEGSTIKEIANIFKEPVRNVRNAVSGVTFKHLLNAQEVYSGRLNPATVAEIKEHLDTPWRGQVVWLMDKYGISYEVLRRIRDSKEQ